MSDFAIWVNAATSEGQRNFRPVVHIILDAIASTAKLRVDMVMKGGVLMDILYNTSRFTTDLDFSTTRHFRDFRGGLVEFLSTLSQAIQVSANRLDYGVLCRIQSHRVQPGEVGNYQTLRINVGYALAGNDNAVLRLRQGRSTGVVGIDYSFNELIGEIGLLIIDDVHKVQVYGELTLVAEKLRAILQQEVRRTHRRQDIYDIHYLLSHRGFPPEKKSLLLAELISKAQSRDLKIDQKSMRSDRVIERSRSEYGSLKDEIDGDLPDFDRAYGVVRDFYESLPWAVSNASPS